MNIAQMQIRERSKERLAAAPVWEECCAKKRKQEEKKEHEMRQLPGETRSEVPSLPDSASVD